MIDIQIVREDYESVKQNLQRRQQPAVMEKLEELRNTDKEWREQKQKVDSLRHEQNEVSERINEFKKEGEEDKAQRAIERAQELSEAVDAAEDELQQLQEKRDELQSQLPNLLHESVPYGESDDDNVPIREWGEAEYNDDLDPHREIAEGLGASFERSAKVAGHGFYYLYGDMAMLNRALVNFAIDEARDAGFAYTETPLMMRREYVDDVTDLTTFDELIYKVEDEDLHLIATSEHPLMAQFADETIHRPDLPVKQCSYSMCFRKEVGTHSVDEKGLFRTHQFNKVELVAFTHKDCSWEVHEDLLAVSESIFRKLELPYRVVNVCTGDIGTVAAKKYDIEAWFPRQDAYKEVVSCSNCTDYQSRALNIRYESEDGGHDFVHTLNTTALATSRAMVAILENYQNSDGSVDVPEVLQEYIGKERLEPSDESLGGT